MIALPSLSGPLAPDPFRGEDGRVANRKRSADDGANLKTTVKKRRVVKPVVVEASVSAHGDASDPVGFFSRCSSF